MFSIRDINELYAAAAKNCLTELNTLRKAQFFCEGALNTLNLTHSGLQNLCAPEVREPTIFVCNHPSGAAEAIILIAAILKAGYELRVFGNPILMYIPELSEILLPIDPYETPTSVKSNIASLKKAFIHLRKKGALLIFPAGEVSSFNLKNRQICDKEWNPNILELAQKTSSVFVPIRCEDRNSSLFYGVSALSKTARMGLLGSELLRKKNKSIQFRVRPPVRAEDLSTESGMKQLYSLAHSLQNDLSDQLGAT
jgi:putative hemolysin